MLHLLKLEKDTKQSYNPSVFFISKTDRYKKIRLISIVAATFSSIFIIAWVFGIPFLRNPLGLKVSIKLVGAICFLLSAFLLWSIQDFKKEAKTFSLSLIASVMALLLLALSSWFSILFGLDTGIQNLIFISSKVASDVIMPGSPSLLTAFNFVLLGILGLLVILQSKLELFFARITAYWLMFSGFIVVLGHAFNLQFLTSRVQGISDSASLYSGLFFLLFAYALYLFGSDT
jgi:hypothetical protein